MAADVLPFKPKSEESDDDHLCGTARCLCCGHEWDAVTPMGEPSGLECPGCHTFMGVLKHPVCAPVGYGFFECGFGSDVFIFLREQETGHMYLQCLRCGDFNQPWNN